jgi:hypothetical protein
MTTYVLRLLLVVDLLINTLLGGRPHQTISGRVGIKARDGVVWARILQAIIDTLFFFDPQHCYVNIRHDLFRGIQLARHLGDSTAHSGAEDSATKLK